MVRSLQIHLVIAAVAIATASGCGSHDKQASPSTVTVTSSAAAESPGASATTPTATTSTTADNGPHTPLHQEFEAEHSVGPNGKAVNASLAGTEYPNSTGMWVGCGGEPATTTYRLSGKFGHLHATAGLQPHTPDQLNVNVVITGDGQSLQQFALTKQNPVPVEVDVRGVDALVVSAIAVNNSLCGASGTPYGALGAAELSQVSR